MLQLYRAALRIRRAEPGLGRRPVRAGSPSDPDVLAFARGADFVSLTNLSGDRVPLPPHRGVLLASADVSGRPPSARRDGLAAPGPRRRDGTSLEVAATTNSKRPVVRRRTTSSRHRRIGVAHPSWERGEEHSDAV